jgi:hypothetical protein
MKYLCLQFNQLSGEREREWGQRAARDERT